MPEMPNTHEACERNVTGTSPVNAFLCHVPTRQRLVAASGSDFLDDLHRDLHRRGSLSPLQRQGVQRWLNRDQRANPHLYEQGADGVYRLRIGPTVSPQTAAADQELADLIAQEAAAQDMEADADEDTSTPAATYEGPHNIDLRWGMPEQRRSARWNQAQWVYSGEYTIRQDTLFSTTYKFRIHTLQHSSRSPELVGKRVVSCQIAGTWTTFAFVGVSGTLMLWSRFRDEVHEAMADVAAVLLESFRPEDRTGGSYRFNYASTDYSITHVSRYCRNCNSAMMRTSINDDEYDQGVHDHDCSGARVSPLAASARRAPAAAATRTPRTPPRAATPVRSQVCYSELTPGMLQ